ncbi:D-lyxose/D-mannose family sugar isomerase [Thermoanaerobacterium thermosaccharolyticum]|uniref:D-lyxose/D-mannose family sugar isomerase n=1 Tax=Thermoanaerobacterium thermosaccharolyticum TaxID=1517 RepID=UPI003DA7BB56
MNDIILKNAKQYMLNRFSDASIKVTPEEIDRFEITDFGLNNFDKEGLLLLTYVNTERYCAKEMVLFPHQTCPEHRHPKRGDGSEGKQETFRCRAGVVYLFVEGENNFDDTLLIKPPDGKEQFYTVKHLIKLLPGQQYTIKPNVIHWFQAGSEGCIVSEFSSNSDDATDIFTDPNVRRV